MLSRCNDRLSSNNTSQQPFLLVNHTPGGHDPPCVLGTTYPFVEETKENLQLISQEIARVTADYESSTAIQDVILQEALSANSSNRVTGYSVAMNNETTEDEHLWNDNEDILRDIEAEALVEYPDFDATRYENFPTDLCCSICGNPFLDPVLVKASGKTYNKSCIKEWLQNHNTDPETRNVIEGTVDEAICVNYSVLALKAQFEEYAQKEVKRKRKEFIKNAFFNISRNSVVTQSRIRNTEDCLQLSTVAKQKMDLMTYLYKLKENERCIILHDEARAVLVQNEMRHRCCHCILPFSFTRFPKKCARCANLFCSSCCAYLGCPSSFASSGNSSVWEWICIQCYHVNLRRLSAPEVEIFSGDDDDLPSYHVKCRKDGVPLTLRVSFLKKVFQEFIGKFLSLLN